MSLIDNISNVSRRQFLEGAAQHGRLRGGRAGAARVRLGAGPRCSHPRAVGAAVSPSVYLGIEPDGTVFIVTHRSEMGTGIRTTLPLVAADELDADWSRVRIEQGLGDTKYGDQNTDGSRSVRDFYDAFRRAGASARVMLDQRRRHAVERAGQRSARRRTTKSCTVPSQPAPRRSARSCPPRPSCPCPKAESLRFKPKADWKFVGKERPIYDLTDITTGKASFGLDIYREGMVYASIEHPPVVGGTVKSVDDTEARKVRGRAQTSSRSIAPKPPLMFQALGGVAVIADNTWAALKGRKALKVEWNDGPNASLRVARRSRSS